MNEQALIQEKFFRYLTHRTNSNLVLNKTMEVLNLGKGAVYKRINGSTALTSAEMIRLAIAFRVSLDNIFQKDNYMAFYHPFWKNEKQSSGIDFMDRFAYYLKPITNDEYSRLTYLANELPITYYFSHKHIFQFLLSIWNHLHWDNNRLTIDEHMPIDAKQEKLRAEIKAYYESADVTEIWNSNMLSNLYQQVFFCITIRAFPNIKFIERLINDIERLINTLRNIALTGQLNSIDEKKQDAKIYLNEFGNYANILLYQSERIKGGFIGMDMPQFMISYNPHFFDHAEKWIDNIKKRSVLISSEGLQYRELFFLKLENDFKAFKVRVEKLISVYYE